MSPDLTVSIEELPVSGRDAGPYGITTGPDGALWFTMVHHGRIGRMTPGGELTSHQLDPASCGPTVIASGPDGALWFTEYQSHRIGRITTAGEIGSFALPSPDAGPFGIAAGADGAMWFTETNAGRIGRITTGGEVTEFPLPVPGRSRPRSPPARRRDVVHHEPGGRDRPDRPGRRRHGPPAAAETRNRG